MGLLEGKTAIITGGASGIGEASVKVFAREGAMITIADINEAQGEKLARMIKEMGSDALFVRTDISSREDVEMMVKKTVEHFGRLDCAFNNAGLEGKQATTAEISEDEWDRIMGINLKGAWFCMKYEIEYMLKHGGGAIVNTSSAAGLMGFPGLSAYTASKHGLLGLTKTAAMEYASRNIRINAICPGVIRTPMVDRFLGGNKELEAHFIEKEPVGRMGLPQEIAEAAMWLCSDKASFVTGASIPVDGGMTAG
jgi:NAD(P)-dependent dehydrogenase (short-subunit alcohol dehydrogenase family)